MNSNSPAHPDDQRWYEIRLQGRLDKRWASSFDAMSLTTDTDGTTLLRGLVADQAALHGLLHQLRDLGLPLITVVQVQPEQQPDPNSATGE